MDKGIHAAVERLQWFARCASRNFTRPCWALKFDIYRFFDSVDHVILKQLLCSKISCIQTQQLMEEIVDSYHRASGGGRLNGQQGNAGMPIGNLTSQLFANVYLDALDHFIKQIIGAHLYLRYTDDGIIISHDRAWLEQCVSKIATWLWNKRRLTLHPHKVSIRKLSQGIDFLGYITLPHYTVIRTKTKRRMFLRVSEKNISSYFGVLKHCNGYVLRKELVRCLRRTP